MCLGLVFWRISSTKNRNQTCSQSNAEAVSSANFGFMQRIMRLRSGSPVMDPRKNNTRCLNAWRGARANIQTAMRSKPLCLRGRKAQGGKLMRLRAGEGRCFPQSQRADSSVCHELSQRVPLVRTVQLASPKQAVRGFGAVLTAARSAIKMYVLASVLQTKYPDLSAWMPHRFRYCTI